MRCCGFSDSVEKGLQDSEVVEWGKRGNAHGTLPHITFVFGAERADDAFTVHALGSGHGCEPQLRLAAFAVGRVSKDGQCDFDGEPNVQHTRRRDEALTVAKALLVPGRRILVQDLDTGEWSAVSSCILSERNPSKVLQSEQRQPRKGG
jgi:hypothetical protein